MFFFEKKNQKTFPGRFARQAGSVTTRLAQFSGADVNLQRRGHSWRVASALRDLALAVTHTPMERSFLLLFFKKEALPSRFPC
jgi:hypothetical protein